MSVTLSGAVSIPDAGTELRHYFAARVSQAELADKAGVSHQFVAAVVAGRRPVSEKVLVAACELGIVSELAAALGLARE